MENFLNIVAIKACWVVILALGAALAGRYLKRPSIVHAFWIVVLLQLLLPPVLEVGVLPAVEITESVTLAAPTALAPVANGAPAAAESKDPAAFSLATLLTGATGGIWLIGTLGVLLLAAVRIRRFGRLLSDAEDAPESLAAVGRELATRLGLARCPRIRLVPAGISPMLWPRLGSLEILFPASLLERLNTNERDTLLAHELAHVRRRDHWVRYLELTAGALFWWHPVVWWARSRLRQAEEECCDGLVLRALPGSSQDYAKGLFKTVEFLAGTRNGLPSLASGIGKTRILEGRLAMILEYRPSKTLSGVQRMSLALLAAGLLLVFPTWADRAPAGDDDAQLRVREQEIASAEATVRSSVLDLERQARELERELREIRLQQQALQHSLHGQREQLELQRLELEVAQNEAAGHRREAEELRRRYDVLRESRYEAQLDAAVREAHERERAETVRREMEQRHHARADRVRALHYELLSLAALLERLEAEGRGEEAGEVEDALEELRRRVEDAADHSGTLQ